MANFLYPERMKDYIPAMSRIYERATYWELDWGKAIIDFMDSQYNPWTDEEKQKIKDFIDYLKYVGETPYDWDIHWGIGHELTGEYTSSEIGKAVKNYHINQKIKAFFNE